MKLIATPLPGLMLVQSSPREDKRGRFERVFCRQSLEELHPGLQVAQANVSLTRGRGTVRGMHYQTQPSLEAKLVRCLSGRVFDVAVDLRAGSPSFLQSYGVELSAGSGQALFVPEGFAHGFQVLEEHAELLYFHTCAWDPNSEGGVRHDDPMIAIRWPLPATTLSERDRRHPLLDDNFKGVAV